MDKMQLLFKKILPVLIVIFILMPMFYSVYTSIYLKSRLASLDAEFDNLSRTPPVHTQIKYNRFEDDERYKKAFEKLGTLEAEIKRQLPSMNNFGSIADSLQALAAECNIEVASLNVFNPAREASSDIFPMKINMECRSTYKAFKKFLWSIENCNNIFFIEKIAVNSKLSDEKLNYNYEMLGYIKK